MYLYNIYHSLFSTKSKEKVRYFCYGHFNFDKLKNLYQKNMVNSQFQVREECIFGREQESHRRLFILIFVGHSENKKIYNHLNIVVKKLFFFRAG